MIVVPAASVFRAPRAVSIPAFPTSPPKVRSGVLIAKSLASVASLSTVEWNATEVVPLSVASSVTISSKSGRVWFRISSIVRPRTDARLYVVNTTLTFIG